MASRIKVIQHKVPLLIIFNLLMHQILAQVQRQDCMNQLQPCMNYLNGKSRPPDSCCEPLDHVIKSLPECLCSLMTIQGADQAEQAGINVTDAQTLPGRCGQRINPLGCITGTPDARSRNSVPSSAGYKLSSSLSIATAAVISVIFMAL